MTPSSTPAVPDPSPAELLEVAVRAARLGGAELMARLDVPREIHFKGASTDLVTDADKASEARILGCLRAAYPSHAILSEEDGATAGSSTRWVIDPLDGTTNYAHGVPHWSVSIAAEVGGVLMAGVVFDPFKGELFAASRGGGATLNGKPMWVRPTRVLGEALLATGFPYDLWAHPDEPLTLFDRFAGRARGMRRMGSAALDLAYVAAGRFDGFYEFKLKAWDVAAGALLVTEAGGVVTHLRGGPLDLLRADVLAAPPALHPQMLAVVLESPDD